MTDIVVATVQEGIDAAREVFSLYDVLVDQHIPWKSFKESFNDLDKYRGGFSTETALRIADIKTNLMHGIDAHFHASQKMYEWASATAIHMQLYIKLFDDHNAKKAITQRALLSDVLNREIAQMNATQFEIEKILSSFRSAALNLKKLRGEHDAGKMSAVTKFYMDLAKTLVQATDHLSYSKELLLEQTERVSSWEKLNQETVRFVNLNDRSHLRDQIIDTAKHLIARCEEYQQRHTNHK